MHIVKPISLRTSKVQPEMLRLHETITDESESIWERDLLRELLAESSNVVSSAEVSP